MNALAICVWVFAGVTAATWVLSVVTREYSWVDRIWSIVPVAYLAIFAGAAGFADARLDVMLVLGALWGARLLCRSLPIRPQSRLSGLRGNSYVVLGVGLLLVGLATFNFARKGGYAPGGEDYRWAILRERMAPWQFQVFNLIFISAYQNLLLLLITLPAYTALGHRSPFGAGDAIVSVAFLAFLVGETVADQQQWNFQQYKRAQLAQGREPDSRFLRTGLFRYSRHPNFFCEQAQWWAMFAFCAVAAGSVLQWTVVGAVLLTLLFIGSTRFTESISRNRYPEYAGYQRQTSMLVPWFSRS